MRRLIVVIAALLAVNTAYADLVELQKVDLTYRRFNDGSRNQMLPNSPLGEGVDLGINLDLCHYFYFNSIVHSLMDKGMEGRPGQFRSIGWLYNIGIDFSRLTSSIPLSISLYHHSQHSLDYELPNSFPTETGIEFKLTIFQRKP